MKKTVITTFAAVAALSAGLVAAKGAHEPSWHTQDHGEIPGLQAVPKDNAERAEKSDDSVKFAYIGDTDGARSLCEEVIAEATGSLKTRAERLLAELG